MALAAAVAVGPLAAGVVWGADEKGAVKAVEPSGLSNSRRWRMRRRRMTRRR